MESIVCLHVFRCNEATVSTVECPMLILCGSLNRQYSLDSITARLSGSRSRDSRFPLCAKFIFAVPNT